MSKKNKDNEQYRYVSTDKYGSTDCRSKKHWENILIEGECRECGLKKIKN